MIVGDNFSRIKYLCRLIAINELVIGTACGYAIEFGKYLRQGCVNFKTLHIYIFTSFNLFNIGSSSFICAKSLSNKML